MGDVPAAADLPQPAGEGEQWSDSSYVSAGNPRTGAALYTRVGRRPNEGRVEAALGIWMPDGHFCLCFAREDGGDGFAAGGIVHTPLSPLEAWRIDVDTTGTLLPRAEALATPGSGKPVTVEGTLRFAAWTPPFAFDGGLTASVAAHHHEQPGSVAGVLDVGGTRVAIHGAGMRDRSTGTRDWQAVPWWKWTGMLVDPDTFVLANEVGTPDGGSTVGGCLMLDGVLAPVLDGEIRGGQDAFVVHVTDAHRREAVLHGAAVAVAPLRQRRDGRLTLVNEGLTRLRWGRHQGIGLSEWLTQG